VKVFKKIIQVGNQQIEIETGLMARQATAAVTVSCGNSKVLVTTVARTKAKEGAEFFPLTVNYQIKAYAAGRVPGGFLKREGRPADKDTLVARLIDRPLRPLFPKGFFNEIQIIASVVSYDVNVQPDMLALIGASASLALSGVPFDGPVGGVRVGFINGEYVLNPSIADCEKSDLELIVAGTKDAVLMVESEAKELPEETMLGAVLYGHQEMQSTIDAINELVEHAGKPKWVLEEAIENKILKSQIKSAFKKSIEKCYNEKEKQIRSQALSVLKKEVVEKLISDSSDTEEYTEKEILGVFSSIEKDFVRKQILSGKPRIDGRDTRTVRPIDVRTGVLPGAHGSALFTRGETQALVVTTLGNERDAQMIEDMSGDYKNRYILQYNFPPFSVGETGFVGAPKRREIGHGNLAYRATKSVFPNDASYPYVVRVVSEVLESNGSSSMATVCGGSLSMMDAGVPLTNPVAGIAMGLIKDGEKYAVLSDILGDEDHLGDMDFKVAGTKDGVTALQMDIKIKGISRDIMVNALNQAKDGRLHILGIMNEELSSSRNEVADNALQINVVKIPTDKIRDLVGKGGATIRKIQEDTGATLDISQDGEVKIYVNSKAALEACVEKISESIAFIENGQTFEGTVVKLMDFGAFVNLMPGKDGLLHISQFGSDVSDLSSHVQEGQKINVTVANVDRGGKIKLVMS
jgi:polyribonucleotide nucleotidyltransferase